MTLEEAARIYITEIVAEAVNSGDSTKQEAMLDTLVGLALGNAHPTIAEWAAERVAKLQATIDALPLKKIEAEEALTAEIASLEAVVGE